MSNNPERENQTFMLSGWNYTPEPFDEQFIQMLEARGAFRLLDSPELTGLQAGQPIKNKVEMPRFDTPLDFGEQMQNFPVPFQGKEGTVMWVTGRRRPVFQRFEVLYPDRVAELSRPSGPSLEELFDAYSKMAELVSADDPGVLLENGAVDAYYLRH